MQSVANVNLVLYKMTEEKIYLASDNQRFVNNNKNINNNHANSLKMQELKIIQNLMQEERKKK